MGRRRPKLTEWTKLDWSRLNWTGCNWGILLKKKKKKGKNFVKVGCGIKKKKISKYSGSFVKNSKFMYLNARIPTAFLPSLSTYHICKKPNCFLSFSLSLYKSQSRGLSLFKFFLSLSETTNPLFSTLPISTFSSRSFDHSLRVSISSSNGLNLSALLFLLFGPSHTPPISCFCY